MVEQEDEEVHVGPIDLYAENERTCSVSTMQGFKSALLWSYWKAKVPFPVETNVWLDNFVLAYKKIVAEKKILGIMDINEGKQPISFGGYNEFCEVVMTLIPRGNQFPWKMTIFAWCFETMSWNIIGRASNVHSVMLPHIDWREDALVLTVPRHKGKNNIIICIFIRTLIERFLVSK